MSVRLNVPGIRMPKKTYKVYYKHPNKFKADTKGFGILPNTGIFTSPKDNFDNLKDLRWSPSRAGNLNQRVIIPFPNGTKFAVCLYRKAERFNAAHRNLFCAFETRLRNHLTPL